MVIKKEEIKDKRYIFMTSEPTSEIDTIYGKKLRVTCIERKYKVVDSRVSFIIIARKEFDEDTTEKMLHEDMELKTFLANYEIANITFPSGRTKIKIHKKVAVIKKEEEKEEEEPLKKEESEAVIKRREIITNTLKRREMFDSLELSDEFLVKDYVEAVEKKGLKITNAAMPYGDLKWLTKKGKIKLVRKIGRGLSIYTKVVITEKNDKSAQLPSTSIEE